MRLFLPVAFVLLAAAFWFASGGSAFDPPERTVTARRAPEPAPAAPAVPAPAPLTQAAAEPEAQVGPADAAAFDRAAAEAERAAPASAPVAAPSAGDAPPEDAIEDALGEALDLRTVTGSVVNVRGGPSTGFDVVGQLAEGARAEILQEADGWAEVRAEDGTTGWMAARFLR